MTVLNKHKDSIPEDAIYIGRGSMWGNPFVIGKDGDRDTVCDLHRRYLNSQILSGYVTLDQLSSLYGKDLVCFCSPARCHGDTLVRAAEWANKQIKKTND